LEALDQGRGLDARARLVARALIALGLDRGAPLLELRERRALAREPLLAGREARAHLAELALEALLFVDPLGVLRARQLERVPELLQARAQALDGARKTRASLQAAFQGRAQRAQVRGLLVLVAPEALELDLQRRELLGLARALAVQLGRGRAP